MKRHLRHAIAFAAVFAGLAAFMLACRSSGRFARLWMDAAALPALTRLNRLTARLPFPLLEAAALVLVSAAPVALILSIRRGPRALRRRIAILIAAAGLVIAGYALLWYPAYWAAPVEFIPEPSAAQLEWLCGRLADGLAQSELRFPPAAETVRLAGNAAGLPGARVKCARYPGWMRALRLSGLFAPWTGEAIVDPAASPALIPFTAVHELMHLEGIAGEGAANIAAWRRCMDEGGAFADSARLWALRYALSALEKVDAAAAHRVVRRMAEALRALFRPIGSAAESRLARALGIAEASTDYAALAGWLIVHPEALNVHPEVLISQ